MLMEVNVGMRLTRSHIAKQEQTGERHSQSTAGFHEESKKIYKGVV